MVEIYERFFKQPRGMGIQRRLLIKQFRSTRMQRHEKMAQSFLAGAGCAEEVSQAGQAACRTT
jgi:hypothetical protein